MNFHCSFQTIKRWIYNLAKTLLRRYHWAFALAGFLALAMAAISWTLETSETYWFWHRYYKITTILFISLSFRLPCLILLSFEMFTAFGILQYTHLLSSSFVQKQILRILRISFLQMETMNWLIRIHFQELVRIK